MTILIPIGIAAWLLASVAIGVVLAKAFALGADDETLEASAKRSPQLQLLLSPGFEHEHAA
jgi:hypothetical protein